MKNILKSIALVAITIFIISCKKDEGKLPNIAFKTGGSYTNADVTLAGNSAVTIGIDASKAEKKDVLKKFNISKSVNGATNVTVLDKELSGADADAYTYDYATTLDTIKGQTNKYTFTVTNRDGLTNQVAVTVTVK